MAFCNHDNNCNCRKSKLSLKNRHVLIELPETILLSRLNVGLWSLLIFHTDHFNSLEDLVQPLSHVAVGSMQT